jgi:aryl-alcohol dehydrogenase-like predicted oxidoreductase
MEYTTLGGTGMEVSCLCLGCEGFGTSDWQSWVLDEEESLDLLEYAIDQGINFFDTSNSYSNGEGERILGQALDGHRERSIVSTKVYFQIDDSNPNSGGLSRKTIEQELDASLNRLDIDTIDLYHIHRWDYNTPIEQTLRTLHDSVKREKVRYIGASSMWAYQFHEALSTSAMLGLERFGTMQNHYNLAYREEEREMLPLCEKKDIGVITWSPLARGYLTRPHRETTSTERGQTDEYLDERKAVYHRSGGKEINERVEKLAQDYGVSMAQISLAWVLHKDWVDVPIVGTTSKEHIDDAVEALTIDLSKSELEYLEEPYEPKEILGHE